MLLNAFVKTLCPYLPPLKKTGRIMRILTLILFAASLQVSARTEAQGISLSLNNVALSTAFNEIQQQTSYRFVFTNEQIELAAKVSISIQHASIEKVLELCFKDQPLTYSIEDNYIIVKAKEKKKADAAVADTDIRGRVSNDMGQAIESATIAIKGTQKATASDNRGMFILHDVPAGSVVIISSIGYEPREFIIGNNRVLEVVLQKAVNALDEMVIKGYYSVSKRLNTGSVARLSSDDMGKQSAANPLSAMQGRLAGIIITQSTGTPGSGFAVQIRGQNSLRNSRGDNGNYPLYVINGVPFTPTTLTSSSINYIIDGGNPLAYMNPSDIESIEVLKDADATAIYGSRGANGVVLITTKKGKSGKTIVNASYNAGFGKVTRMMPLLQTPQYLQMRHEAFNNDGVNSIPSNAYDINGTWDSTRNTDWQKVLIGGTAHMTDVQVSVAGGNENTQFLFANSYRRETTVFPGDFNDKKGTVYFNLNHKSANQRFKLSLSANYVRDDNNILQSDLYTQALKLAPDAPALYTSDGKINWENSTWNNPAALLKRKYRIKTDHLLGDLMLSYQLCKGFQIRTNAGYTTLNTSEIAITPISTWRPSFGVTEGSASFANANLNTWIIEPQLEYSTTTGNIKWDALAGTTFQDNTRQGQTNLALGITNDALLENESAASRIVLMDNNYSRYRYNAIYARLNATWKDKLVINLTGRRDGSSRFGADKQFANFGAIGAAWVFSKSALVQQNLPFISFGKLRGSYGITGNDQIGDYGYLDTYSPTTYPYQGIAGLYPTALGNPDYGWETNKKIEIAADWGFFNDRFLLTADYYRNRSSNQLVGYALPPTTGFSTVQENLNATVQNSGWEIELSSLNIKSTHFSWKTSVNLSVPRNKLISYPNIEGSAYNHIYAVGKPLGVFYALHYSGVDPATGAYSFQDVNQDGTISIPNDQLPLKSIRQDYYGGIQNSLSYGNWSLDVLFQFVKQTGKGWLSGGLFVPAGMMGNQPAFIMNRWQKPGDNTDLQRFTQDYGSAAYQGYVNTVYNGGDNLVENASYVRLKNVYLSYNLPAKCLEKMHFQTVKLYLQGQNVLLFTKFSGNDPENYGSGRIPPLRVISAGIQLTL